MLSTAYPRVAAMQQVAATVLSQCAWAEMMLGGLGLMVLALLVVRHQRRSPPINARNSEVRCALPLPSIIRRHEPGEEVGRGVEEDGGDEAVGAGAEIAEE